MNYVRWNGRARIDELSISPEQYKWFFGCYNEFGIKYDIANLILAENAKGDYSEVVPCDELNHACLKEIADSIKDGEFSGTLRRGDIENPESEGLITLSWTWDPEFFDEDGNPLDPEDIPRRALGEIARLMLFDECVCGEVYP